MKRTKNKTKTIIPNPWQGEIIVSINGHPHKAKLTMGALAKAEHALGMSLMQMLEHLEKGTLPITAMMTLITLAIQAGQEGQGSKKKTVPLLPETLSLDGGITALYRTLSELFRAAFYGASQD